LPLQRHITRENCLIIGVNQSRNVAHGNAQIHALFVNHLSTTSAPRASW